MRESKFNVFIPFDIDVIEKASKQSDDDTKYDNMIFSGVASDNSKDAEGETLDPKGYELSYFLKSGLFNLEHLPTRSPKNKSRFWIGEPTGAEVVGNKLIVKGKLWKASPEARAFWDKALEMKESGSNRKPGMSIEGKALERDSSNPKIIKKALITNIALTFNPVNGNTSVDITKGIEKHRLDEDIVLSLSDGTRVRVDRELQLKIEKSEVFQKESNDVISKAMKNGRLDKQVFENWFKKFE